MPRNESNDKPVATYGYLWMLSAIGERKATDCSKVSARNELKSYLEAPLDSTSDVVAWWGVSTSFLPWNMLLMCYRNTQHSTPFFREWHRTTCPFRARQHLLNVHSRTHLSLTTSSATGWHQTFEALQNLKSAYRNGHMSAAGEALHHYHVVMGGQRGQPGGGE